jgi:hypothetical protein
MKLTWTHTTDKKRYTAQGASGIIYTITELEGGGGGRLNAATISGQPVPVRNKTSRLDLVVCTREFDNAVDSLMFHAQLAENRNLKEVVNS